MYDGVKEQIDIQIDGSMHASFSINTICGCRIVYGPVPASAFGMLTHGFSKKALMAIDIADRMGASFVIGEPSDLEELRKMDLPVSEKRHTDSVAASRLGLHCVAQWLRTGERGASSNAMCKRIFGVPADARDDYPRDPDDLRRCLLFLDATDSHKNVPLMADVSPAWAGLVEAWEQIAACFREESTGSKSAPKTYDLMQKAIATQEVS